MKAASVSDIKKELQLLSASELSELCLKLAKYKKENKEYLSYLLYESHDRNVFIKEVKEEIDALFIPVKAFSNLYFIKKGLRKILRVITRYSKFAGDKALSAELLIHFCILLKDSGIPYKRNQLIVNMYQQQLKKINTLVNALHEDLQADYAADIAKVKQGL